jgi:uncharacterized protein YaaN involved in tellurite resistance
MDLTNNSVNGNSDLSTETGLQTAEDFSIEKQKQETALKLQNSPEVLAFTRQINITDVNSIMTFGTGTAQEIAKFSDKILNSMELTKVEDSSALLTSLNKIMDKFDVKDFDEKQKGLFDKLFNKAKNSIEALFQKYHTMGDEVDKVFVTLKQYETEIKQNNRSLEDMFTKNVEYYEQLGKYIVAGEMALTQLREKILPQMQQKAESSGDRMDQINLDNATQAVEMLDQRVYDLKLAESVSLQSMPMIKSIEQGNNNLIRKINSAFIITMPIFKQCLTQAIMLKRQAVQANAISALDQRTNELLLRNAENTALQSKITTRLASGSAVDIATLEKSWQTIMNGITETRQIQSEMRQAREDGAQRLIALKQDYQKSNVMKM